MFNILEDNRNVESLIHYLDKIIVGLRQSNKLNNDKELLNLVKKTYDLYIIKFHEKIVLLDKEIDKEEEEIITNIILELIHELKKIK